MERKAQTDISWQLTQDGLELSDQSDRSDFLFRMFEGRELLSTLLGSIILVVQYSR